MFEQSSYMDISQKFVISEYVARFQFILPEFPVTGRMPRSGKLPVLDLLTGQKSGFSPRRGDSLARFRSHFAGPTGTWVRLAVQNFRSIGAGGWECGPQNIKNFHFLLKSRPAGATPLTDFQFFRGFYTPNYPTLVF